MNRIIICLIMIFVFLTVQKVSAQKCCYWGDNDLPEKLAQLSINVNYVDSFYVLKVILKVTGKEKIYLQKDIHFKDFYSFGNSFVADYDGALLLTKVVMNTSMIWSHSDIGILYGMLTDSHGNAITGKSRIICLNSSDSITTNVKLNNMYPLELGYYTLYARIKVKYKGQWAYVYSDILPFEVDKLPAKSADFHNF